MYTVFNSHTSCRDVQLKHIALVNVVQGITML